MTVGTLLLNPAKAQRAKAADTSKLLLNDVIEVFARLMADLGKNRTLLDTLKTVVMRLPQRILTHAGGGMDNAKRRLLTLLEPIQQRVQQISAGFTSTDPKQILASMKSVLDLISELLGDLDPVRMRSGCANISTIIKEDMGINPAFLEELLFFFIDEAAGALQDAALTASPDDHSALVEMALMLKRLKRGLRGIILFPDVDPDKLAQAVLDSLAKPEVQNIVKKAKCISEAIATCLEVGGDILDIVPFTGLGSHSVGAGEAGATNQDQYLWYATWLLGGKDRGAGINILKIFIKLLQLPFPEDDYVFEASTNKVVRRNFLRSNNDITTSGQIDFNSVPVPNSDSNEKRKYTFKHFEADTLESVARHTAWITHAIEFLLHAISIEKGDFISNLGFMAYNTSEGLYKAFAKKPFPTGVVIGVRMATYLLCSLEGIQTKAAAGKAAKFWFTLWGMDALEANIYYSMGQTARDALLSFMTLYNYDGPKDVPDGTDDRPNNREEVEGVVSALVGLATSQILVRLIPRKDYIRFFNDAKTSAGYWIGGGIATGVLAGTLATTIAECISWAEDFKVWGNQLWKSSLGVILAYWPALFLNKEGDTDGGKYNPVANDFAGYPDPADDKDGPSPYKLPWEKDKTIYVSQGNQGFWSHNNKAYEDTLPSGNPVPSQVYAYDFALDQEDEILAGRGGTVVDFFDWVPNDQDVTTDAPTKKVAGKDVPVTAAGQTSRQSWNFVVIRHDVASKHDKGVGGAAVTTYGIYGHGRNGSVRKVFGERLGKTEDTVTPEEILGLKVVQGQVVMHAGSTGNSLHNHVHMEVRIGAAVPAPGAPFAAVSLGSLSDMSIPFIFAEVDRFLKPKGVPQSLDWHTSDNTKVTP